MALVLVVKWASYFLEVEVEVLINISLSHYLINISLSCTCTCSAECRVQSEATYYKINHLKVYVPRV